MRPWVFALVLLIMIGGVVNWQKKEEEGCRLEHVAGVQSCKAIAGVPSPMSLSIRNRVGSESNLNNSARFSILSVKFYVLWH